MLSSLLACSAAYGACGSVIPPAAPASAGGRPVTAADLIQMRDVGDPESASFSVPSPFGVSPDGKRIAFYITRPSLSDNRVCRALVMLDLAAGAAPALLDQGGDNILIDDPKYGALVKPGTPTVITPIWSPDGRRIAYLRADNGVTRAWVWELGGAGPHGVGPTDVNIDQVGWTADSTGLIVVTRPGLKTAAVAIDREGLSGWLYDSRIWPDQDPRPKLPADMASVWSVIDLSTNAVRPAADEEARRLQHQPAPGMPAEPVAISGARHASTMADAPSPVGPRRVRASLAGEVESPCPDSACAGIILNLWWRGDALLFLRREGWDHEAIAMYRWNPRQRRAVRLWRTTDVLHGCVMSAGGLICTWETSTTPRSIVSVDPASGRVRPLLALNPEFLAIRLPEVRRLRWRNDRGLEAWGDLVLPPDYRPGQRVPLVVVQYHSVGFLRGGIGNEYPIFLFAQRGMAVLSFERPPMILTLVPQLSNVTDLVAFMNKDWGERRSLLSAVLRGVDLAIANGVADPARIGITGLSDGSSTVAFALINSQRFAAAASSTCCVEPNTVTTFGGIGWSDFMQQVGYPPATRPDPAFWAPMSVAQNARSITTPLLLQSADSEFRLSLEAFEALRELKRPVELYVFPNELHNKIEPAHRAAVFDRSLDWFDFWLRGHEVADPAKAEQYGRWEALRAARQPAT